MEQSSLRIDDYPHFLAVYNQAIATLNVTHPWSPVQEGFEQARNKYIRELSNVMSALTDESINSQFYRNLMEKQHNQDKLRRHITKIIRGEWKPMKSPQTPKVPSKPGSTV